MRPKASAADETGVMTVFSCYHACNTNGTAVKRISGIQLEVFVCHGLHALGCMASAVKMLTQYESLNAPSWSRKSSETAFWCEYSVIATGFVLFRKQGPEYRS